MTLPNLTAKLLEHLEQTGVVHTRLLDHPPSRSSNESRAVRLAASGLETTGAKALAVKLTARDKSTLIAIFVLPGDLQFDSDLALQQLPEIKRLRFLTRDEVLAITSLEVGAIPPFGAPLIPGVDRLFVDPRLMECPLIGFNAAAHVHSVIMPPADWLRAARPDGVFSCSSIAEAKAG